LYGILTYIGRRREDMETKTARFEARLPLSIKQKIERAAAIKGYKSLSEFVIRASAEKAEEILEDERITRLSIQESENFYNALINPPEINGKLKKAAENYKKKKEEWGIG
jgi:uncharacterized protein (DUF1778 family)